MRRERNNIKFQLALALSNTENPRSVGEVVRRPPPALASSNFTLTIAILLEHLIVLFAALIVLFRAYSR
jgi:hypothetical protein